MAKRFYTDEDKQLVIDHPELSPKELFDRTNLTMDQVYMFRKIKREQTKHEGYERLNRLALGFRL